MTDIHKIIERLEAGETGREIDAEIEMLTDPYHASSDVTHLTLVEIAEEYTTSLDSAAALHKRLLPEYFYVLSEDSSFVTPSSPFDKAPLQEARCATIPAAWTCAILKAWAAKEGAHE